jgi:electron transfer flavoprotein beta subunit
MAARAWSSDMVDGEAPSPPGPTSRLPGGPLVVACLDPVDLRPEVDPLSGEVRADWRRADLSAADSAALEHSLRAAEAWRGTVLAVAAGPPALDPVLRQAVALGAGALRVPWEAAHSGLAADPVALAGALAAAIRQVGLPALVVCGDRSPSRGIGAVPALIAHHLGAEQALGLVSLTVEQDSLSVVGERRLDGGWRERLRVRAPAVCSVEAAGVRLRRAPMAAALHSTRQPIEISPVRADAAIQAASVRVGAPRPYRPRTKAVPPPAGATHDRLLALTGALRAHDPPRIVGPIAPGEAAREILEYLVGHGYSIPSDPSA